MMSKSVDHAKHSPARSAFTLIELLVVMGIIAILATLAIATMAPILENSRVAATKAIIVQIDSQLRERLAAFNTLMENDARGSTTETMVKLIANTYSCTDADAKVLYRKIRYRMEFPQRVADLVFKADGTPSNYDSPLLSTIREAYPSDTLQELDSKISSSELLYLLLTEGRSLGTESYSVDGISAQYITDQDGDGFMEIRDAWGNELRFYASPTALFRPNPSVKDPQRPWLPAMNLALGARFHVSNIIGDDGSDSPREGSLYQDPLDRRAAVLTLWMRLKPPEDNPLTRAAFYYHPATYFSYLIISGGPDGDSGLWEPNFGSDKLPELDAARHAQPRNHDRNSIEFGAMFDNITNQNLRK